MDYSRLIEQTQRTIQTLQDSLVELRQRNAFIAKRNRTFFETRIAQQHAMQTELRRQQTDALRLDEMTPLSRETPVRVPAVTYAPFTIETAPTVRISAARPVLRQIIYTCRQDLSLQQHLHNAVQQYEATHKKLPRGIRMSAWNQTILAIIGVTHYEVLHDGSKQDILVPIECDNTLNDQTIVVFGK